MAMNINEIMTNIYNLSRSQGYWGRLYYDLLDIKENDPSEWEKIALKLEQEEFENTLDLVLYFEEGKSPNQKPKKYTVVVTTTFRKEYEVEASSEQEAIEKGIQTSVDCDDALDTLDFETTGEVL